ncbi:hypothetical protein [Croceicoccus marinus]|uniref:EF-hand domain-containing protein n=1 Tax=Croceicoccus marinus TaxID=450378 RepID=A0A7G6VTC4_9SPHN|nr:hypothetical protein [Croceicoccus marinus]QNE04989.1 hypothetical protein H4O24_13920 [Croceicoccus marinus]
MKKLMFTTIASAAALGLAACGSEDVENTPIDDVDELVDADVNEVGYPVGGELNPDQQTAFDTMDRQAASDEYDMNYDAIRTERVANADLSTGDAMSGSGSMDSSGAMSGAGASDTGGDAMSGSGSMTSASSGSGMSDMPSRSAMDFGWLDRNDDGKLSVAEYAIWAVPVDPTDPAPNDAKKPYMTSEEINQAGETFFYFDQDGSTYLSEQEFAMARNSAMTPS